MNARYNYQSTKGLWALALALALYERALHNIVSIMDMRHNVVLFVLQIYRNRILMCYLIFSFY